MTSPRSAHRQFLRFATALLAGSALVLLSGCKVGDFLHQVFSLSGKQSTMVTAGPVAEHQWDLFMVTVYVTMFIFVVVGAVLAYAQIKFRAKSEADEHTEVEHHGHGNPFVEIGLIVASVALLVIIAIPTLHDIWYTHDVPDEEKGNAMNVTATGYQWWFQFKYDDADAVVKLPTGGEAPLVTGNELVVPAGTPVRVQLRTVDVIHSFWIPKLAGKVDMMPNRANFLWFKADQPGYFYGQCAEYCGESHAIMRFRVIALSPPDYAKWLENQKQSARSVTAASLAAAANEPHVQFASMKFEAGDALSGSPEFDANPLAAWHEMQKPVAGEDAKLIAQGHQLFADKTCMSCHTVRGHYAIVNGQRADFQGITGPDLTHVGARSTIAAGVLENTPEHLHAWIKNPEHFKPGNKMWFGGFNVQDTDGNWQPNPKMTFNDQEIDALVAYLHSLK